MFCSCIKIIKGVLRRFRGAIIYLVYPILYGSRFKIMGMPLLDSFISITIFPKGSLRIGKKLSVRNRVEFRCSAFMEIGDNCFFNNFCSIVSTECVNIGSNCLFGENVHIYDNNHVFNKKDVLIRNQGFSSKKIFIGNNVWIGSNVCILKGASIGDNSVIGANCVISTSIPANSIVTAQRSLDISPINYKNME